MKKFTAMLVLILCAFLMLGRNTQAEEYGNYSYTVLNNGTVGITYYNGDAKTVNIPASIDGKKVTAIGTGAFECKSKLTLVTIPNGVTTIGKEAFTECTKLEKVHIPGSVKSIGDNAFSDCSNLISVTMDKGLTTIGFYAFGFCEKLPEIIIPDSVTEIGHAAFICCNNLKKAVLPKGLKIIENDTFDQCDLSELTIPKGVTRIGTFAFSSNLHLKKVTIPDSVTEIGKGAFDGCESLSDISIPGSVKTIRLRAFCDTDKLLSVKIPRSVTTIEKYAFGYRRDKKTENGREKVPGFIIKGYPGTAAEKYADQCGLGFYSLIPAEKGTVEKVGKSKYEVTSTKTVSYKASASKKSTTINIPKTVKIDGRSYKVTKIDKKAFAGSAKLKSVTIPASVKEIGAYAFHKCRNLSTVRIKTTKLTNSSVKKGAFKGINKKATFYLPKSKKKTYKKILLKRGASKKMKFK